MTEIFLKKKHKKSKSLNCDKSFSILIEKSTDEAKNVSKKEKKHKKKILELNALDNDLVLLPNSESITSVSLDNTDPQRFSHKKKKKHLYNKNETINFSGNTFNLIIEGKKLNAQVLCDSGDLNENKINLEGTEFPFFEKNHENERKRKHGENKKKSTPDELLPPETSVKNSFDENQVLNRKKSKHKKLVIRNCTNEISEDNNVQNNKHLLETINNGELLPKKKKHKKKKRVDQCTTEFENKSANKNLNSSFMTIENFADRSISSEKDKIIATKTIGVSALKKKKKHKEENIHQDDSLSIHSESNISGVTSSEAPGFESLKLSEVNLKWNERHSPNKKQMKRKKETNLSSLKKKKKHSCDESQTNDCIDNFKENPFNLELKLNQSSEHSNLYKSNVEEMEHHKRKHKKQKKKSCDESQNDDCIENFKQNPLNLDRKLNHSSEHSNLYANNTEVMEYAKKKHKKKKKNGEQSEPASYYELTSTKNINSCLSNQELTKKESNSIEVDIKNSTFKISSNNIRTIQDCDNIKSGREMSSMKKKHKKKKSNPELENKNKVTEIFNDKDTILKEKHRKRNKKSIIPFLSEADDSQISIDNRDKMNLSLTRSDDQETTLESNSTNDLLDEINVNLINKSGKTILNEGIVKAEQIEKRHKNDIDHHNKKNDVMSNEMNVNHNSNIKRSVEICVNQSKMNLSNDSDSDLDFSDPEFDRLKSIKNVLDFNEDIPDFKIPTLHKKESVKNLSVNEQKELRKEGVEIKNGKFMKEEDEILLGNWNDFVNRYKINDPILMLGINNNNSRDSNMLKFLKSKHFYVRLAKDLNNRTLYSVYKHARVLLDPDKDKQRFTPDEVKQLFHLHSIHGNKWTVIANKMGKTTMQCQSSFRSHTNNYKTKGWSVEEEKALKDAVIKVCGSEEKAKALLLQPCGVSWDKIAALVKTRNSCQCRQHWLFKIGNYRENKFTKWDQALLLYLLHENLVDDESLIDWVALFQHFQTFTTSYAYLAIKWGYLKRKVPLYKNLKYPKIIEYLYENYLPQLMKKCNLTFDHLKERCK